ncbi:glycosyltransferase [Desulfovibrio sp. X2]|uniref:glycosyltransferase n=1 Tax=Desulfovibrio sp. X2 TaxID=941449 RepID=UPI000409A89C|nr:glycosyltransferase [Desulfovibrio sp. X2]
MRVAFLIDEIFSPAAGTERQLLMLIEGLDRREFEPHLCVLRSTPWIEREFARRPGACPLHVLNIASFFSPAAWRGVWRFSRWLRQERIDVLQMHFRDSALAGVPAAALAGTPLVVGTRKNQGYWMNGRERFLQRLLNRGVDVFVANSEDTRDKAVAGEGIARERMRVIHNGLDLASLPPPTPVRRARARALLGIPERTLVVGMVANLRPVKRVDVFVEAAARVAAERPHTVFVVVGEGEERPGLEARAAALGLNGNMRFLGRRTDVADLLPGLDVGVLTSDSESFSNSMLEYMAAGLPVAATAVGGCREALGDSPAGVLVAPGDAEGLARGVGMLLGQEGLRREAAARHPRRVAEMFSRERYVADYAALYRKKDDSSERRP